LNGEVDIISCFIVKLYIKINLLSLSSINIFITVILIGIPESSYNYKNCWFYVVTW